LVGMLAVAISHMAASVYLAHRITNRTDEALRDRHTSWSRISYLLCHDAWIALYLLIVIFYVIWLVMGSITSFKNRGGDYDSSECGDDMDVRVTLVLVLGWFYLFAGPTVLSCNLCCVCCDKTDYAANDEEFATKEAEKEAKKQQRYSTTVSPSKSNNFHNSADDIETPNQPQEAYEMPQTYTKTAPSPPRTYSTEGVPITDDGNADIVEAEVLVEEDVLPPPMAPPKTDFTAQAAKAKAGETAAKAQATAEKAVKSLGGWLNKKKKGGDGDSKQPPERKATVY
jgi:hypothetical protein